jgi:hypothetical protein
MKHTINYKDKKTCLTIESNIVSRILSEYGSYLDYGYSNLDFKNKIIGNEILVLFFKQSENIIDDIIKQYAPDISNLYNIKNFEKVVILKKDDVTYQLYSFHLSKIETYNDNVKVEFNCGNIYAIRDI